MGPSYGAQALATREKQQQQQQQQPQLTLEEEDGAANESDNSGGGGGRRGKLTSTVGKLRMKVTSPINVPRGKRAQNTGPKPVSVCAILH
jgi:hypothetical protein